MPVIDVTFYPLIITERPTDNLFLQPPAGTDMGAARLCPITDVRPGDWVLGNFERPLSPARLDSLMQSVACFPALPVTLNDYIALDGESLVWHANGTALVIPREYLPGETYANRPGGYRVGDRVERTVIYEPIHNDYHDRVGEARPVIQRGTVTAAEDGSFSVAWSGYWGNGRSEEVAMRLADPVTVERERAVFGFAVGDTVTTDGSHATGVVLELYVHHWAGTPCARVYWPGSPYCSYDFAPTNRYVHKIPHSTYTLTTCEEYPSVV